jgi:EAL domain-containing protein (putative c-di-GMP-specific phosphodiesterase class I)
VDNFGSSVTTMNMLRDLPVDNIKIDRQFLDAADVSEDRQNTVLSSLIQLAQKLGFRIVTEGVESAGQVDTLRDMGCDYVQGYVYSPPLPWASLAREMGESGVKN